MIPSSTAPKLSTVTQRGCSTDMSDLIKELDAAVTGEGTASQLREEYPEASEQAIENALRLAELTDQIKGVAKDVARKAAAQEQQRKESKNELKRAFESARLQVAALAAEQDSATEEDKQLLQQRTEEQNPNQTELGKILDPT